MCMCTHLACSFIVVKYIFEKVNELIFSLHINETTGIQRVPGLSILLFFRWCVWHVRRQTGEDAV